MTAAIALEKGHLDRSEQLEQLRRQMAAVSGKVGARPPAVEVPEPLAAGLPRGVVAVLSGARSLPVGMAAAVTAAGGHVAVVGLPDFGLLAAAEMGADPEGQFPRQIGQIGGQGGGLADQLACEIDNVSQGPGDSAGEGL